MMILIPILGLTALVWALVYARHGSLLAGCGAFIILGYVFNNEFWQLDVGPIPLTLGRFLLTALVVLFLWRWGRGQLPLRYPTGTEWIGLLLLSYLTLHWLFTPAAEGILPSVSPFWRLIASFWMPAVLIAIVRHTELTEKNWKRLLSGLTILGLYLALTGLAEISGQWWAVFPRFISNPELGTHFGRARGPALMSASLGIYLTICFWAAWFMWAKVGRIWRLLLTCCMILICVTLFFTYTRSTYLGLAVGLAVIPYLQFPRQWRTVLVMATILGLGCGGLFAGQKLLNMGRKDGDGSALHSVYQRASFLYVSYQMFQDYPMLGCGFGRFYDKKIPYLADRSQPIELDSLRNLDHHNTYLSVLTETGLIGFLLFMTFLAGAARSAWQLARDTSRESWVRSQGLFALAVILAYAINGLFHDLTLSPYEQWILCFVCGITFGLRIVVQSGAPKRSVDLDWDSAAFRRSLGLAN